MLTPRQRWAVLAIALLLTLLLVYAPWQQPRQEAVVGAVTHGRQTPPATRPVPVYAVRALSLASLQRTAPDDKGKTGNLFPAQTWYVPPPPPKPAPPMPPALPFVYLGKLIDGNQVTVFVSKGDRNLALKVGDAIDGMYQVDLIAPPMMTFTYLPLRMQQSLEIGGTN